MGRLFTYLVVLLSLCLFSCKRHVCPTYYSSFNIEKGGPEKFFNYFLVDTAQTDSPVALKDSVPNNHRMLKFEKGETPAYDRMFKPPASSPNGLVKKKFDPLALLFPKKKQKFMKVVRAKVGFSELDSTQAAELYAITDSLFSADRFKRDQYIYMKLFGFEILDSMEAQKEREQAMLDTLNEDNLPKKEKRRLRKARKKKYRQMKKAAKRGEISQEEVDAYYEEHLAKPKKEKKKKRKKGEEAAEGEEGSDPLDGDSTDPFDEEEGDPKKKKKRKKKGKDPPEEDDGD